MKGERMQSRTLFLALCLGSLLAVNAEGSKPLLKPIPPTTLQAVTLTDLRQDKAGEAPRFAIVADAPITYEAYPMPQVYRFVVDLQRVSQGSVEGLSTTDGSSVKRVDFQQKELNSLPITRVIFHLSREMTGQVVAADGGKRLLVDFSLPARPVSSAAPEKKPAPAASPTEKKAMPAQRPLSPLVPAAKSAGPLPQTREIIAAPLKQKADPAKSQVSAHALTGIRITKKGIHLQMTGAPAPYKYFVLRKPGRLVIDLPALQSSLPSNQTVNRFRIARVRVGQDPQRTRLVFDALQEEFPHYTLQKKPDGLMILLQGK